MVKNSPAAADKEMLEKIAAVNIGPGMEFDTSVLTGDVAENWKTMLTEIQLKLIKECSKIVHALPASFMSSFNGMISGGRNW